LFVLEWVLGNLPGFVAVLLAFGFIIFIHESGHFLMARRVGIRCPRFSLGFGPRLFAFDFRGTEFTVCVLPFGGFVQMLGEDPAADESQAEFKTVSNYLAGADLPATREQVLAQLDRLEAEVPDDEKREFNSVREHVRYLPEGPFESLKQLEGNFNDKTIPQRMAVVVGGVFMNFVSALILFWIVGSVYGLVDLTPNSLPQVMKVYEESPAAVAGLKYGDRLEAVNGVPVVSGSEMIDAIEKYPGRQISITVARGDQTLELQVVPNVQVGGLTFHPQRTQGGLPVVVAVGTSAEGSVTGGLAAGDVIVGVNGKPVGSLAQMMEALRSLSATADPLQEIRVTLDRKGHKEPAVVELLAAEAMPVGKIGIMPAQVTEFRFIDQTTNLVEGVVAESPAAQAGFQAGDTLYLVNGRSIADVESLDAVLADLSAGPSSGEPLRFDLERQGSHVRLEIPSRPSDTAALGLQLQPITFGLVVKHSFWLIGRLVAAPVIIVQQLAAKVLNPDLVKASMSGPIGIMQMIFELSDQGLGKFLYIVALINAAVGAFNVIPFPALDGARLLVLAWGGLRGRELDYKKEAMVHQIGLFVLLAVVLLVTILDVQRLIAGVPLTK